MVIPTASTREGAIRFSVSTAPTAASTEIQISSAFCSTQPGFGKYWGNSFWAMCAALPFRSNRIALVLVVP
ncbi:hypothetical protein D3C81_1714730 [compost metagenome]